MGKRSDFERKPRDFYPTPKEAVLPLLPHLLYMVEYYEPCYGEGDLVRHLKEAGHICVGHSDVEVDATDTPFDTRDIDCFITNPPWDRKILHPIIENLSNQAPTWLLFDADWMHTKQSAPFMQRLVKIVSVGRVKWIPDSKMTGKDNCCWYLFDINHNHPPSFYGRTT